MLQLVLSDGRGVDLAPGTSIQIVLNNPMFDEEIIQGSFSYPFKVPATDWNKLLFGFAEVVENVANMQQAYERVSVMDEGQVILTGTLKFRSATPTWYSLNLEVGYSSMGASIKERLLSSFSYGGPVNLGSDAQDFIDAANDTVANPGNYPFIFAPVHRPGLYKGAPTGFGFTEMLDADMAQNFYFGSSSPSLRGFKVLIGWQMYGDGQPYTLPMCPFPYLHFVFTEIFKELGLPVEEDFFDAEIKTLAILSNVVLETKQQGFDPSPPFGFAFTYSFPRNIFTIGELLPVMTVNDMLKALKSTFGLCIDVTLSGKLIVKRLANLISSTDSVELTATATPDYEIEPAVNQGINIGYTIDSLDSVAEQVKDFEDINELPNPVADIASLPARPDSHINDVIYVESEDAWYIYTQTDPDPPGWVFYSWNYRTYVIGTDGEGYTPGVSLTVNLVRLQDDPAKIFVIGDQLWMVPSIGGEGYSPDFGAKAKCEALHLAFYRGLQPFGPATNVNNLSYPMLTDGNVNLEGVQIGSYTLRYEGPNGLYAKFLKPGLELKRRGRPVKRFLYMNRLHLANLDLTRKLSISRVDYFIKQLSFSLPLVKAPVAQLLKCPLTEIS